MHDPTHDEMYDYLTRQTAGGEDVRFDIEEAIYWFSADYHGGQWSNLYSTLSTSEFRPGMNARRPYAFAKFLYDMLVEEYTNDNASA
jgi:hypothetical protein